jgi:hypothetical protein
LAVARAANPRWPCSRRRSNLDPRLRESADSTALRMPRSFPGWMGYSDSLWAIESVALRTVRQRSVSGRSARTRQRSLRRHKSARRVLRFDNSSTFSSCKVLQLQEIRCYSCRCFRSVRHVGVVSLRYEDQRTRRCGEFTREVRRKGHAKTGRFNGMARCAHCGHKLEARQSGLRARLHTAHFRNRGSAFSLRLGDYLPSASSASPLGCVIDWTKGRKQGQAEENCRTCCNGR